MAPLAAAGVPLNVTVPLPLSTNVTPAGGTPLNVSAGNGKPLVVTVNELGMPARNATLAALVMAGASLTISVNACTLSAPTLFDAVNVRAWTPPIPEAGVPLNVPLLVSNDTPRGSAPPVCVIAGAGVPTAVTVKLPGTPAVNVVLLALVNEDGPFTASVNDRARLDPAALVAVKVIA